MHLVILYFGLVQRQDSNKNIFYAFRSLTKYICDILYVWYLKYCIWTLPSFGLEDGRLGKRGLTFANDETNSLSIGKTESFNQPKLRYEHSLNSVKNFEKNFRCYFYHLDAKLVKLWFNSSQGNTV